MKKIIFVLVLNVITLTTFSQTSVANGNWTNPATWGGMPPTPGSTVIINHTVVLDMDYGYSSGGITINASGSLNGNIPTRALGVSGGHLVVNGSLNIGRVAITGGTASNSGTFKATSFLNGINFSNTGSMLSIDSLSNSAGILTNNGIISANYLMNNATATYNNNGSQTSIYFLNLGTATNTSSITLSTGVLNGKTFTNNALGNISITGNFLNTDSISSPVFFTNNGKVIVSNNWANKGINATVNGSGKFCVQNASSNSGIMSGNFDFCDQTGGSIDANTGSISGSITYCVASACTATGINDEGNSFNVSVYPNPFTNSFSILLRDRNIVDNKVGIEIYNILGDKVFTTTNFNNGEPILINTENDLSKGVYFLHIFSNQQSTTVKLITQ